uniref:Uncharacterized protein n=1 Tax=Tetradesmus obliquus TaxID=3088 RepID=A0A383WN60_TETOB|eukprot:jgi/Sobl393_1/17667/SZX78888.1
MASSNTTPANPAHTTQQKGDAGHSTVLEERFDPDAMLACLAHPGIDTATKERLKMMHKKRRDGNGLCVTYKKNNKKGYGRLYADKGLSLQMVPSDIRNALCSRLVHDVDMANAHPNFELHLAKKHGWVCDQLQRLCCNREQVLQEMQNAYGIDRTAAKVVLLKLLYLGGLPLDHRNAKALEGLECGEINSFEAPGSSSSSTYTYLEELQAELRTLASNIAAQYPEHAKEAARQRAATKKTSGHPLATAVSLVVGDLENRALLAMKRELEVQGRCVTTLVYDGLHVMRLEGETQLPAELLMACETAIQRDTGAAIKLAQKPMETTLQLDGLRQEDNSGNCCTTCMLALLRHAKQNRLIRMWGEVWEPVPGTICAYQPAADGSADEHPLRSYINSVLADTPSYYEKVGTTQNTLVTFLEQYQHKDFPMVIAPNRDLLSFANGVYVLPEDRFISNDDAEATHIQSSGGIARHHIPMEFTGSTDTPKFDKLVTYQLDDGAAYAWFLTLLGRMQYRVGQLDN